MKFTFFKKHLERKLFNKIFFIYSMIIVIALFAFTVFITQSMIHTLRQKELNSNMQLLGSINSYLEQKYYSSLSMMQQIYSNNDISSDLIYFLTHDYSEYYSNRLDIFSSSTSSTLTNYQTYINAFFIRDPDIASIVLYSSSRDFFYVFGDTQGPRLYDYTSFLSGSTTQYSFMPVCMYRSSFFNMSLLLVDLDNTSTASVGTP